MIHIRTGGAWRHDPRLTAALARAPASGREALRGVVDALAIEVEGVDITAGRAEGPLLETLEDLLRAVARVVGGASHATVAFADGGLELLVRRRDPAVLLTVVSVGRPSRVLARDVEVDLEQLAAAALDAAADLCRELAAVAPGTPGAAGGARRLQAAARDLRRTAPAPVADGPFPAPGAPSPPPRPARQAPARDRSLSCRYELFADEEGLLLAYEGGRPDLGSLLVPGRVTLLDPDGREVHALGGFPFLVLRDLSAFAGGVLDALRRGEGRHEGALARGRVGAVPLAVDLRAGTFTVGGDALPCGPLELVRALAAPALAFGRAARARNPRQAENAVLVDLEAAASDRLALAEELEGGDLARSDPPASPGRAAAPAPSHEPLGPGRLRRVGFRRAWRVDVGAPVNDGLHAAGRLLVAAGRDGLAAVDRHAGAVLWRTEGAELAFALPGAVLAVRAGRLTAHALRGGGARWTRPLPGEPPTGAVALARGPIVLADGGALTGLDPRTGRTLWRRPLPAASWAGLRAFGGIAAAAADTGLLYGVDAAGRLAWRVRSPGPLLGAPTAAAGACVVLAEVGAGAALLAVDPASGVRLWEAPLDLSPSGPAVAWGRRVAVGGTVAGDPVIAVLRPAGRVAWTVAPTLAGAPRPVAAGPLLAVRDAAGALAALDGDGRLRWTRPPPAVPGAAGAPPAAAARGLLLVGGEGVSCVDAATGELLGAVPEVAPIRLEVDGALHLATLDADGVATGFALGRHLSVV